MSDVTIRILHEPTEQEPFVVLDKPAGLPTAPLHEGEPSALTQAIQLFPCIQAVVGRKPVEKGLVHRIDTATSGCVLIATTQAAYDTLLTEQKNGQFAKSYLANVEVIPDAPALLGGFPPPPAHALSEGGTAVVQSRFRGYGIHMGEVRPVTEASGRAALKKSSDILYQTHIVLQSAKTVRCTITAGYRHQVRCHLAWIGLPVQNDSLYNPRCKHIAKAGDMAFTACALDFLNPFDGKMIHIEL